MVTERQIQANRANAQKCTGQPPEGKRISSKNAALRGLVAGAIVLKGESMRRYNEPAAAVILQFQPRIPRKHSRSRPWPPHRWRLLRTRGTQTVGFELGLAKTREKSSDSSGSRAVLTAVTFRSMADTSRVIALLHRLEVSEGRQYYQAPAMLLKLHEIPNSAAPGFPQSGEPPRPGMTIFESKPNSPSQI